MDRIAELPFWHFFHQLEKQLSYERWIDKYKLFLLELHGGEYLRGAPARYEKLLRLVKALFLQNINDETRFEALFEEAWQKERQLLEDFFATLLISKNLTETDDEEKPADLNKETAAGNQPGKKPDKKPKLPEDEQELADGSESGKAQSAGETTELKYYYNPPAIPPLVSLEQVVPSPGGAGITYSFNFHDEYLPITRREMNKAWQYLRYGEPGRPTDQVDIAATVKKLASEAIFIEPVFVTGKQNREDTLLMFVDCNGSMVPFHELSRRLVASAKAFGGHRNADVFYFRNFPMGYVYRKSNLTQPIKLIEAFAKANRHLTTAVVISDAGFASSYGISDKKFEQRMEGLKPFFDNLSKYCARTLWLNPMPENRWHKPAAEAIGEQVLRMAPVMEKGLNTFQSTLRNLAKIKSYST